MKRRRFLSLLGAGVTAPLLPLPSVGSAATATAGYSPAAVHGAILHAQSTRYVSAWGLSKALNVPAPQASELMIHLSDRGIIAPVRGARISSQWAASRVHNPIFARAPRSGRQTSTRQTRRSAHRSNSLNSDTDLLMAYLRDLSSQYFAAKSALPA